MSKFLETDGLPVRSSRANILRQPRLERRGAAYLERGYEARVLFRNGAGLRVGCQGKAGHTAMDCFRRSSSCAPV